MEQFVGQIMMVGFSFAPSGWALCNGQILPINEYQTLFSLLGTQYGGDGQHTFALPDLRGRVPIAVGTGTGLAPFVLGQAGGAAHVTIAANNLPAHSHQVSHPVSNTNGTVSSPSAAFPAIPVGTLNGQTVTINAYSSSPSGQTTASFPTATVGNGQPLAIEPPFLCVNFIIALTGIYPSRS